MHIDRNVYVGQSFGYATLSSTRTLCLGFHLISIWTQTIFGSLDAHSLNFFLGGMSSIPLTGRGAYREQLANKGEIEMDGYFLG